MTQPTDIPGAPTPADQPAIPHQPMPEAFGAAEPPKKSRAGLIVGILVAVLVLCGGAGVGAFVLLKDVVDAATTRVVEPDALGGRPKITDANLLSLAESMRSDLTADVPEATSSIATFYGDLDSQDLVMVVAVSGLIASPESEIDDAFDSMASGGLQVDGVTDVDSGDLGGEARCGNAESDGTTLAVCAWADRGSLGMIVYYFTDWQSIADEFIAAREQIEQQ